MTDPTRSMLYALRKRHGAESAVGHACSNLLELTENLVKSEEPDHRARLVKSIEMQRARLSNLLRDL